MFLCIVFSSEFNLSDNTYENERNNTLAHMHTWTAINMGAVVYIYKSNLKMEGGGAVRIKANLREYSRFKNARQMLNWCIKLRFLKEISDQYRKNTATTFVIYNKPITINEQLRHSMENTKIYKRHISHVCVVIFIVSEILIFRISDLENES